MLRSAGFALACAMSLSPLCAAAQANAHVSGGPVAPANDVVHSASRSISECEQYYSFYCLADIGVEPGHYTIQMSRADAEGVPIDCAPAEKPQRPEHRVACEWFASEQRLRANASLAEPYVAPFSFAALAQASATERPAQVAELILEGYAPLPSEESDTSGCTHLTCRWTYPSRALRIEESGTVTVFVEVTEEGRSSACWTVFGPGDILNADACERLTAPYVRFVPASDTNGEPIASVLTLRMTYALN